MIIGGAVAARRADSPALHFALVCGSSRSTVGFGLGFYLLHGSIQVHVTELAPNARGAAASLHSCFFFLGQAIGPVIYGIGFAHGGPEPTLIAGDERGDGRRAGVLQGCCATGPGTRIRRRRAQARLCRAWAKECPS